MKTTDNQEEIFDIVDRSDIVIGQRKRWQVHKDISLIHRAVYILLFNSQNQLFFQQRSETKDTDPLLWTVSCTGHVESGQTYLNAANRELEEELGITSSITFRDKFLISYPNETEMTVLFEGKSNGPFRLHPLEIKDGRFFSQKELRHLLYAKTLTLTFGALHVLNHILWL